MVPQTDGTMLKWTWDPPSSEQTNELLVSDGLGRFVKDSRSYSKRIASTKAEFLGFFQTSSRLAKHLSVQFTEMSYPDTGLGRPNTLESFRVPAGRASICIYWGYTDTRAES